MLNDYIPYNEAVFQGLSFTDDDRLFKWNGSLFRAIPSERASFCRDLFDNGIMRQLITKKLFVETEITPLKMDHFEIILKHRTIPFVSYPQEWGDVMLKDAALHQLEFCLELIGHNLESADAHPLNILFDGPQPVFVDFGSIAPIPVDTPDLLWTPYEQFCSVFIRPLRLMAQGHARIARWLLHDYELGILKSDVDALIYRPLSLRNIARNIFHWRQSPILRHLPSPIRNGIDKISFPRRHAALNSANHLKSRFAFLRQLHSEVENIGLTSAQRKQPNGKDRIRPSTLPSENWTNCYAPVESLLSDLRPASVLNIGRTNHAMDAPFLAARNGIRVVALNPDATNVRDLYTAAQNSHLPVLPLQINLFSPSHDLSNFWLKSASERLRCDLVLALDLVDHLPMDYLRFDLIVERLSSFSNRWLLVDFCPDKDFLNPESQIIPHYGYSKDGFMDELSKCFRSVRPIPLNSENRVLLLCEK